MELFEFAFTGKTFENNADVAMTFRIEPNAAHKRLRHCKINDRSQYWIQIDNQMEIVS